MIIVFGMPTFRPSWNGAKSSLCALTWGSVWRWKLQNSAFVLHTCSTRIFHWGNKITLCARCKKTRKCCFHINLPHRKGMINSLMTVMCSCLQKSWTQQVHDKWLGGSHVVQPIKKERAGHRKGMITVMLCSYLKKSWTKKGHDKWLGDSHVMCHLRKSWTHKGQNNWPDDDHAALLL